MTAITQHSPENQALSESIYLALKSAAQSEKPRLPSCMTKKNHYSWQIASSKVPALSAALQINTETTAINAALPMPQPISLSLNPPYRGPRQWLGIPTTSFSNYLIRLTFCASGLPAAPYRKRLKIKSTNGWMMGFMTGISLATRLTLVLRFL